MLKWIVWNRTVCKQMTDVLIELLVIHSNSRKIKLCVNRWLIVDRTVPIKLK